jgi:hypothetical protein
VDDVVACARPQRRYRYGAGYRELAVDVGFVVLGLILLRSDNDARAWLITVGFAALLAVHIGQYHFAAVGLSGDGRLFMRNCMARVRSVPAERTVDMVYARPRLRSSRYRRNGRITVTLDDGTALALLSGGFDPDDVAEVAAAVGVPFADVSGPGLRALWRWSRT